MTASLIPGNILPLATQDMESATSVPDVTDWIATNNCNLAATTNYAHDGLYSIQMTSIAAGDMNMNVNGPGSVGYPVNIAIAYTVTGWAQIGVGSSDRNVFLYVNWFDATPTFISNTFFGPFTDASSENHFQAVGVLPPAISRGASADAVTGVLGVLVQATGAGGEIHQFDYMGIVAPQPVAQAFTIARRRRNRLTHKSRIIFLQGFRPPVVPVFIKPVQPIVIRSPLVALRDAKAPVFLHNPFRPPDAIPRQPIVIANRMRITPVRVIRTVENPLPSVAQVFTASPQPIVVHTRRQNVPHARVTLIHNPPAQVFTFTKTTPPIIVVPSGSRRIMQMLTSHKPILINKVPHGGAKAPDVPPIGHHKHHWPHFWPTIGSGQ